MSLQIPHHQLLKLSEDSPEKLEEQTAQLLQTLKSGKDLPSIQQELEQQPARLLRRVLITESLEEAVGMLEKNDEVPRRIFTNKRVPPTTPPVVFMFPGQGAQYAGMGHGLYQTEAVFRSAVNQCAQIVHESVGIDLKNILFPTESTHAKMAEEIKNTAITQPALFTIEYALAQLWISKGIVPSAMIGHSIGEYAAACVAGVFTLDEALPLVCHRGQFMQELPPGLMASLQSPLDTIEQLIQETGATIATRNAPGSCVISGSFEDVENVLKKAEEQTILHQRIHTSHAFHSTMMEPARKKVLTYMQKLNGKEPKIPFISNLTGTWFTDQDAKNPTYWGDHLRYPVLFSKGLQQLMSHRSDYVFLELGPGNTLCTLARQHMDKPSLSRTISTLRHPKEEQPDSAFFATARGKCWLAGL